MKLAERLKTKKFKLQMKQHAVVLDYVTAIEDAMRARAISQSALATLLHKSRAWVSKVLRQQPNLTFFTAVEIADALGLKLRIEVEPWVMEAETAVVAPSMTTLDLAFNWASSPPSGSALSFESLGELVMKRGSREDVATRPLPLAEPSVISENAA